MKNHTTATRIIAGVLPAMALFATPALAQIETQTTPPPVPTSAAPEAAAPAATTPAPDAAAQQRYQASLDAATGKTVGADAPVASRPAPTRASPRAAPVRPVAARATVAAPAPIAAPVASAPVETAPPVSRPVAAPVADTASETTATQATATPLPATGTPAWLWLIGGIAALAAIVFGVLALRRRDRADEWDETQVEPARSDAEPVPVAETELAPAASDEVAAITAASAPVPGRPWIELALRPLRAGSDEASASVDLELTLANAGAEAARDVRVSTFMLGDAAGAPTDMERLLATGRAGTAVDAGSIGAGQGTRIDAHLTMPRDGLDGATFQPVVVADVRYTLPDGSEGRTAAAFTVGVDNETEEPTPFRLGGDVREDVAATLHGVPERV